MIEDVIKLFASLKQPQTIVCLVALSLCKIFIKSLDSASSLPVLVDNNNVALEETDRRPRVKSGDWLNGLGWDIKMHLVGLNSKKLNVILKLFIYTATI